ncbi:hypothetical protein N7461_007690 [Penicillium sp. DV-2018c]|nr:hypothetical protein N7461_007690 [Penicillium sp. DV-2018c]
MAHQLPIPAFVHNLFPQYPTAQGADGSAPLAAGMLVPRAQEARVYARSFAVSMVDANTPQHVVLDMLPIKQYRSLDAICLKYIKVNRVFALSFGDIREAADAMVKFQSSHPEWPITPVTRSDITAMTGVSDFAIEHGMFLLRVQVPPQRLRDPRHEEFIKGVMSSFGDVQQFVTLERGFNGLRYMVGYYNVCNAKAAFTCLDGLSYHGHRFEVSFEENPPVTGVDPNAPRGHPANMPRHNRNGSEAHNPFETMPPRTLNRGTIYSAGQSSPRNISTDSALVPYGNQTMRHSATQSLFQNVPSGLSSARTEHGPGHFRGQSLLPNLPPTPPAAAVAERPARHTWGPGSNTQRPSSIGRTLPFTWERE